MRAESTTWPAEYGSARRRGSGFSRRELAAINSFVTGGALYCALALPDLEPPESLPVGGARVWQPTSPVFARYGGRPKHKRPDPFAPSQIAGSIEMKVVFGVPGDQLAGTVIEMRKEVNIGDRML